MYNTLECKLPAVLDNTQQINWLAVMGKAQQFKLPAGLNEKNYKELTRMFRVIAQADTRLLLHVYL